MTREAALNRMKKCTAQAGLVLAVVVAMVAPRAQAATVTLASVNITIAPTMALSGVYLVEDRPGIIGQPTLPTVISLGSLTANSSVTRQVFLPLYLGGTDIFGRPLVNYFTILGVYDVTNGGVAVGFRDAVGASYILNSATFGLAVPGGYFTGTESGLAAALEAGDAATFGTVDSATVDSVLQDLFYTSFVFGTGAPGAPISLGSSGASGSLTLVDFSTASLGGTASLTPATATPEPGSLALLGAGWLLLVFKRTRTRRWLCFPEWRRG